MRDRRRVRRGGIASAGLALVLAGLSVDGLWVESARAAEPDARPEAMRLQGAPGRADRMRPDAPGRIHGRGRAMSSPRLRREVMNGLVQALPAARPIERLAILRSAMRLPFAERRALAIRLRRFETLSAGERTTLVADLQALLARADEDIAAFERNFERWERLSESERDRYREQFRRLQAMPFEERERLLEEWDRSRREGEGGAARDGASGAGIPMGAQSPSGSAGNPVETGSGSGENPGPPSGDPPPAGDEWTDDEAADDPVKEGGAQAEP